MWPTYIMLGVYGGLTGRNIKEKFISLEVSKRASSKTIVDYQEKKMGEMLALASRSVPFYSNQIDVSGDPAKLFDNNFFKLPIVEKEDIRKSFNDMITHNADIREKLCVDYTGGSTGQPLKFAYNEGYKDIRWAMIYHNLTWAGYKLGDAHGFIYGSNADVKKQYSLRQKFQDFMMNAFQVNAFFLDENGFNKFLIQCKKRKPKCLIGYASALYEFACFCKRKGLPLRFSFLESTSEYLSADMRQTMEQVFNCKVYDRYGCREVGNIAHECAEHKGMHINWQTVYVEIENSGKYPEFGSDCGDIVISSLENTGMPLLRYQVGDIGKIETSVCKCGMQSPRLFLAGVRTGDLLYAPSGHKVSPPALTLIYKDLTGIKKIQFVQKEISSLEVSIVRENGVEPDVALLRRKLLKVFGSNMNIAVQFVNDIPKEISGKYRLTKRLFQ